MEFKLTDSFIEKYKNIKPDFGFNGLGWLVYARTYSRLKDDGSNEQWWETIKRVVEGTYNIQKEHIDRYGLGWNAYKAQYSAQEMYDRMFNMKFLPGGRGLWAMGSPIITQKKLAIALFNCSAISTENIKDDPSFPFVYAFDALMCGVGIGFDIRGAGKIIIQEQNKNKFNYIIPDSREGWVESLKHLIDSFFGRSFTPIFDYSQIRPAGIPLKTFGGVSSGSEPLIELHKNITNILSLCIGMPISKRNIVDIFNIIAKAVVSGNVRRSALLAAGDNSDEFLNLKDYSKNPEREFFGWCSNNSVLASIGMDYKNIAEKIRINGEPGLIWLENAHENKRMGDLDNGDIKDNKTKIPNACSEILLEGGELCNLVELFLNRHESKEDFIRSIKFAYLYAKTVTLLETHWSSTNKIILRNRRIGTSVSGIVNFLNKYNLFTLKEWLNEGYNSLKKYDKIYSEWFAIPRSIRLSTLKPSGTISLLAGATPGIHFPESRFYIRRIRLSKNSSLIKSLKKSGYKIENAIGQEESTVIVEIPVDIGSKIRTLKDVSMWEQLLLASFIQREWADNSVSITVTFDPETEGKYIEQALNYFQFYLKTVSFLPRKKEGAYKQMPYEAIDEDTYNKLIKNLKPIDYSNIKNEEIESEKYCDGETCTLN